MDGNSNKTTRPSTALLQFDSGSAAVAFAHKFENFPFRDEDRGVLLRTLLHLNRVEFHLHLSLRSCCPSYSLFPFLDTHKRKRTHSHKHLDTSIFMDRLHVRMQEWSGERLWSMLHSRMFPNLCEREIRTPCKAPFIWVCRLRRDA